MPKNASVARIAEKYVPELAHDRALVILRGGGGWISAVTKVDGEILAWDGIYYGDDSADNALPVLDHDFDGWDDARCKLVSIANSQLLGPSGVLLSVLSPTYSPADVAAKMLQTWADRDLDKPELATAVVLAYVPITRESITAEHAANAG